MYGFHIVCGRICEYVNLTTQTLEWSDWRSARTQISNTVCLLKFWRFLHWNTLEISSSKLFQSIVVLMKNDCLSLIVLQLSTLKPLLLFCEYVDTKFVCSSHSDHEPGLYVCFWLVLKMHEKVGLAPVRLSLYSFQDLSRRFVKKWGVMASKGTKCWSVRVDCGAKRSILCMLCKTVGVNFVCGLRWGIVFFPSGDLWKVGSNVYSYCYGVLMLG
jgi:hypothetical protein